MEPDAVRDYFAHPTADIEPGARIGPGTKIWHYAHVREQAIIGPSCTIGRGTFIDKGVQIGAGSKVQNYCSLYHGVTLEDYVFIGPHVVTTNDLRPRAVGEWKLSTTLFKHGCSVGAGSVIVCGIEIGAYAMVAAGSVVTRDVPPHTLVKGNPARAAGVVCQCGRICHPVTARASYAGHKAYRCLHCNTILRYAVEVFPVKSIEADALGVKG